MKKIFLFIVSVALVGCTKDLDPNFYGTIKPKHPYDEVWINNREEPQHTDPALVHGVPDGNLARNTFARLVSIDPKTSQPIPDLASRWDISKDGRICTFYMRKNAIWSDGKPITAVDMEYSWKRVIDPNTASEYQGLLSNVIENGDAFAQRAIHLTGFSQKVSAPDIQSIFTKHEVSVSNVQAKKDSTDYFVFVQDGSDKQSNTQKMISLINEDHPWGPGVTAEMTTSDVVGVKALDDERFEVKLVGPLQYFLILAEVPNFAPVPKHIVEKFKDEQWTKPENVVVSGPFILKEEQFKQYKIYEKNPKYWDEKNIRLKRVKIVMIEKETASLNSYKVGETDWIGPHLIPSEQIGNVKGFQDFHNDPYLGVYYYVFNTKVKPFNDPKVRQALSLAIDREQIVKHVLGGEQIPFGALIPDGLAGYKGNQVELYNPDAAKKLLAEAGYPGGKNFPKFKFVYDTKESHQLVIQAVQEMWKQTLGINIESSNVEWKIYLDRMSRMEFDMTRQGWIGDFSDPYTYLELIKSTSGNNHTGWVNKEFDRLVEASNQELDVQKRFDLIRQAEKIFTDEVPMIPIYLYTKTYMLKPYVKGFYPDYQDHHPWQYLWIDPDWKRSK